MCEHKTPKSRAKLWSLVAAIIAVVALVALALTVLWGAGEKAKAFSCHRNLIEVGRNLCLYAMDHDGHLPEAMWCDRTLPYGASASLYTCPALPQGAGGYAMNGALRGRRAEDVGEHATEVPMGFDGPPGWNVFGGVSDVRARHPLLVLPSRSGEWRVVYLDGHVACRDASVASAQQWEPRTAPKPPASGRARGREADR